LINQNMHDTWQSLFNKNVIRDSQYYFVTVNIQLWVGKLTLRDLIKYDDKIRE